MSVEGVEFGSVALSAAARDLTAPLVLLRQLSFQLDSQLADANRPDTAATLKQLRLTVGQTFDVAEQLKLAMTDAGELTLEPVQMTGLCRDIDSELAPLQRELGCRLDFELPRRDVVAVGNYRALKTIVMGLLSDSLRYGYVDDVNKRIVRARVKSSKGQSVLLAIHDNGPSVNLVKALSASADPATVTPVASRPLMGSLNLLLADKLVRAMNGHLAIHNGRRGGITIEASLPASRQLSLLGDISG